MPVELQKLDFRPLERMHRARDVNLQLSSAQSLLRPLTLHELTFQCLFLHIGPGVYDASIDPGVHQHPNLQLEYVLQGNFVFHINDARIDMTAGQGLFIPQNTPHIWSCRDKGSILGAVIDLSGHESGDFAQKLSQRQQQPNCTFQSPAVEMVTCQMFQNLLSPAKSVWSREKTALLVDLWLLECVQAELALLDWMPPANSTLTPPRDRAVEAADHIMNFLEVNYMHQITLENIAPQIGISSRQANRLFKKRYHETISQALMRIRLDRAFAELQNDRTKPVKSVAYSNGFRSTSYFTRCFQHSFGMPPKYVRKSRRPEYETDDEDPS